jgi:hypothetical protein
MRAFCSTKTLQFWTYAFILLIAFMLLGFARVGDSFASQTAVLSPVVTSVSNRAEMVSGGDVLVAVDLNGLDGKLTVSRNGEPVTSAFSQSSDGRFLGLVPGLNVGSNTIRATVDLGGRRRSTDLTVINWPLSGPIFSGPHSQPFFCQTEAAALGPPLDEDCRVMPRVTYYYKSVFAPPVKEVPEDGYDWTDYSWQAQGALFSPLPNPMGPYPIDLATTTNSDGRTVPFIVRVESGVIDRGVYHIAILDDPHSRKVGQTYKPTAGWNRNVTVPFGGDCSAGGHVSGAEPDYGALYEPFLRRGYAVVKNTLNLFGVSCNDVISAEALMMTKERFIEQYGPVRHTIGVGSSAGSIQQHMIASNYPGLLDGLMPMVSFPDLWTLMGSVHDCFLLNHVFGTDPIRWTPEKQQAFTGMSVSGCAAWDVIYGYSPPDYSRDFPRADYRGGCDPAIPREYVYDPVTQPRGIRCTAQDAQVNILGADPETGFAYRPYDNTGIQYGLTSLNEGRVSKRDFIDINAAAGGFDVDGNMIPARTTTNAPQSVIERWYAQGRVTSGAGGLPEVPIIDRNAWLHNYEIHHSVFSHELRDRLIKTNGQFGNQVLWSGAAGAESSIDLMEQWLENVDWDTSSSSRAAKVARARPTAAHDRCEPTVLDASGGDPTICGQLFPYYGTPRLVAGSPFAEDIIKCHLKPLDPTDYSVTFTSEEWAELEGVFPSGVCDWSKPGVGQVPLARTWISYGPAVG